MLALLAGRAASLLTRRLGHGGGTVLPGHVIPRLDPHALQRVVGQLSHGSVLVSGTNGKTTTTRMVAQIASAAGLRPIHNRSGANLATGVVSAVAAHTDVWGRPRGDLGVFEVDEAHVPALVRAVAPRVLALTNLFRDQLDRYGEVDLVAQTWRGAIEALDPAATLVLNADDPILAQIATFAPCRVLFFGVEDPSGGTETVPHDADRRLCPVCGQRIRYATAYYGHLGHYRCDACGWQRPTPGVALTQAALRADGASALTFVMAGTEGVSVTLPLPGLYNAYNALAAAAICTGLGIAPQYVGAGLADFAAVFGRQERIAVGAGLIVLTLVKNPVGFNQVLQSLGVGDPGPGADPEPIPNPQSPTPNPHVILIAINDRLADGTDVSWLWDVDFELLAERGERIVCTGLRAHDMALRLKYATVPEDRVTVEPRLGAAVATALAAARGGSRVLVFPTYTAMLEIRQGLQRAGIVLPFWED